MSLDHYRTKSKNIRVIYCYYRWCIHLSINCSTQSRIIFWQPVKFETCKSWYFHLRQLLVIYHSLQSNILRTLLRAFVMCRLEYCNSLLAEIPICDVSHLQSVQNATTCLFGGVSRYDSVEHVLHDKLHLLPVMQRVKFKVGYKAINGLAPLYLKEFYISVSSISALSRNRSAACGDFIVPFSTRNIVIIDSGYTYVTEFTSSGNS